MTPFERRQAVLAGRDPETLVGPLFQLCTRLVTTRDADLRSAIAEQLVALAAHPGVDPGLRLAVGTLAPEQHAAGQK